MANTGKVITKLTSVISFVGVENPLAGRIVNHVVKIFDMLFADEFTENIHIAIRQRVAGENVMIRDDDDFFAIPNFRRLAKLAFEHADCPRSTHVVGH